MNNADKPAYPTHEEPEGGIYTVDAGLTKREYFAAMAMQGILSTNWVGVDSVTGEPYGHANAAKMAVLCADELLKQLEK